MAFLIEQREANPMGESDTKKLPAVRTYAVTVEGFDPILFSARSPAKARAAAWRQFLHYDDRCTFRRFMEMSRVARGTDPGDVGKRVMVAGEPATVVIPSSGWSGPYQVQPAYIRDNSDVIFRAHPSEVHALET